jgi:predicted nucleic acid-binding Zn ribbon protein
MATYIYETVPDSPGEPVRRFEVKQSMKDAPLTREPETGKPVRRVIAGGLAIMTGKRAQGGGQRVATYCGRGRCGCC